MNPIYRSIWSGALNTWIAVSELTKGKSKNSSSCHGKVCAMTARLLKNAHWLATGLLVCSANSWALPTGEQLVAGQAAVSTPNAGQMQINQSSQKAVINWQGFSINPAEAVNIQQPNAQAALLNRVVGQDASQIQGQLNANGQVYLVNPNGVLFSNTAQVDVGGLVATTHNMTNQDFINGNHHFTQNGATGSVENHGTINAKDGGVVALIGEQVTNTGTINTPKGTTALAAGKTVDLDFQGDGLVAVNVTEAALNAQLNNQGTIQADGGRVVMTAKAANQLLDTVLNQNGIVKAQGLIERNGEIMLDGGDNGEVNVSGTLSTDGQNTGGAISVTGKTVQLNNGATVNASGQAGGGVINIGSKQTTQQTNIAENASVNAIALDHGNAGTINVLANMNNGTVNVAGKLNATASNTGNGGKIDTSAAHVKIADSAKINTQAKYGNSGTWLIDPYDFTIAATGGDITGTALSTALTGGNVTIQTAAFSATCTGAVCGAGNIAGNGDIFVRDVITWAANNLTLSAFRNINIDSNLNGSGTAQLALEYGQGALAADNTSDYIVRAAVNLPAGNNFSTRLGSDGALTNYTVITNLGVVNDATTTSLQGIQNNLTGNYALGGNIDATPAQNWASATGTGFEPIGTFTGQFHGLGHTISNLTINSARTFDGVGLFGDVGTGGILRDVGLINALVSTTSYSYSATGGLVGNNSGTISNAYATGSVSGTSHVGGLVGENDSIISNAYATGSVSGKWVVGGLVGINWGTLSNVYATGNIRGNDSIGGLAGSDFGTISTAYATGNISGNYNIGGLVGNSVGDTIGNVYATGSVSGVIFVGGLVGVSSVYSIIDNAYATGNVSGNNNIGGLVGGYLFRGGTISNAYATGNVSGTSDVGGLVGYNIYGNGSTINNSHYNIDQVLINGSHFVTQGGIYDAQYQDWMTHNQTLNISNYAVTLPLDTSTGYYRINSLQSLRDLLGFADNPTYKFRLNTDVNLAAASGLFIPYLAGEFDGASHILSNLTLNQSFTSQLGMFGIVTGAVKNLGLTNVKITGYSFVGGLVGENRGSISNVYATGNIIGTGSYVGGLVGDNYGSINNAYATGNVIGIYGVGGLVGSNEVTISNAYAIGNVNYNIGGLVGNNSGTVGRFTHSFFPATINNAFWNTETTGKDSNSGIGSNRGTLNNVSGKTTAEMMQLATFSNAGWDIANTGGSSAIWRIYEGQTAPLLRSFLIPLTITADNITKTYNGLSDSVLSNASYSIADASTSGHLFNQANPYSIKNVGSYTPTGLYSDQQGYDISYVDGVLTINKANLLITANDANKVYDGRRYFGGNGVRYSGFVNGETDAVLFGKLRYGGSSQGAINAGYYWITPSGLDADNYQISYQDGRLTIEPSPFNMEDQLVPLQVATTFLDNQKKQLVKHDSEANIVIENGGIKLPDGIGH